MEGRKGGLASIPFNDICQILSKFLVALQAPEQSLAALPLEVVGDVAPNRPVCCCITEISPSAGRTQFAKEAVDVVKCVIGAS